MANTKALDIVRLKTHATRLSRLSANDSHLLFDAWSFVLSPCYPVIMSPCLSFVWLYSPAFVYLQTHATRLSRLSVIDSHLLFDAWRFTLSPCYMSPCYPVTLSLCHPVCLSSCCVGLLDFVYPLLFFRCLNVGLTSVVCS